MTTLAYYFAAQDPGNLADLAQYGVLGLVVLGFVFGKIVPGYILDRREKEIEARDAKIERMSSTFEEKAIPALLKASEVLEAAMGLIEKFESPVEPTRRAGR